MLQERFTKSEVVDNHLQQARQGNEHCVHTLFKPFQWKVKRQVGGLIWA